MNSTDLSLVKRESLILSIFSCVLFSCAPSPDFLFFLSSQLHLSILGGRVGLPGTCPTAIKSFPNDIATYRSDSDILSFRFYHISKQATDLHILPPVN